MNISYVLQIFISSSLRILNTVLGMIESDPVNVKESYGNQQTSVEYVNNHQHDQQNLSPEENPTNSHELKLYKFLGK